MLEVGGEMEIILLLLLGDTCPMGCGWVGGWSVCGLRELACQSWCFRGYVVGGRRSASPVPLTLLVPPPTLPTLLHSIFSKVVSQVCQGGFASWGDRRTSGKWRSTTGEGSVSPQFFARDRLLYDCCRLKSHASRG